MIVYASGQLLTIKKNEYKTKTGESRISYDLILLAEGASETTIVTVQEKYYNQFEDLKGQMVENIMCVIRTYNTSQGSMTKLIYSPAE